MVRLVRTPKGELVIDETGKQNGRGAYLCRRPSCWDAALKGQQLGKSLKMEIGERERKVLRQFECELAGEFERELTLETDLDRERGIEPGAVPESDPGS
jgi:predicted RNA-binding protein YlxR (DUF448 family)